MNNYLKQIQAVCKKHGIVFILDEMITGFRWHMKGAQHLFGVTPDLCTFGKGMANGFSVAAVAGKREIMQQGSTDIAGMERLFLLSTTHGAEMCGLGAFIETVRFMEREQVVDYMWNYGKRLVDLMHECAHAAGIAAHFKTFGSAVCPMYQFYNDAGEISFPLRTLFIQEMVKHGVLMPNFAFSFRHGDTELELTRNAAVASMAIIKKAVDEGIEKYLVGPVIKPVFRQFN